MLEAVILMGPEQGAAVCCAAAITWNPGRGAPIEAALTRAPLPTSLAFGV